MKRFYIPTTSLNFNNILSSESISPKAFYKNRSFGYGRWGSILENPLENSIVVYDYPFTFTRPTSEYEDHPLLIEVLLDDVFSSTFIQIADHVFLCDKTIYLNPFSSQLFFFSDRDKNIALSMSEASIETKVLRLYQKKIQVVSFPYSCPQVSFTEIQTLNYSEIEKDKKINRMKGLLYGYYVGAILSSSKDILIKLNATRQILNIYASILSSIDRSASALQRKNLHELYQIIQPEIPLFKKLSGIISDKGLMDSVISIIRGQFGSIPGEYNVDYLLAQLTSLPANPDTPNPVIEQTNNLIKNYESLNRKAATLVQVSNNEILISDLKLSLIESDILSENDKNLIMAWINDVFSKDEYNGRTSTFKEKLSDDVTFKAKELFGPYWESSNVKVILNDLRRHVRGAEYNYTWEDNIFSTLASVITKGDDWQKLLNFMQVKCLIDYKLAFAIYGTLNGFANLPRDFTDLLYECDRNYVGEVYKEFYRQLFGSEIAVENISIAKPNQNVKAPQDIPLEHISEVKSEEGKESDGDFEWLFTILRKEYSGAEKNREKFEDHYGNILDTLCKVYKDRFELLKQIEQIPALKGIGQAWTKVQKVIINELKKSQIDEFVPSLFNDLEPINQDPKPRDIELTKITPLEDCSIRSQAEKNEIAGNFVDCSDVVIAIINEYTAPLGKDSQNKIVNSYKIICEGYGPTGYYTMRRDSKSNRNTIDHFLRYCTSKKNIRNQVIKSDQVRTVLNNLQQKLFELYGCTND